MTALLPPDALKNHIAVLGKTGSGKTSTAKRLIEEVVATGARVCVLDPIKSDWRGMVSSASGTAPGLPFVILGGPHGRLALSSTAGAALGRMVGEGKLPLSILDLADFRQAETHRFFAAFAEALFRSMTGVLFLVLEEAHEFAPKERQGGEESNSIHWAKKLASAGRSKGLRLVVCSQRVQDLHNTLLGSCETLFAHRQTQPAAQEPILKWVKANTDKETTAQVAADLSRLPTGEAWILSGEAMIAERRRIPKFETYDNSATPEGGAHDTRVVEADVNIKALAALLGEAVAEAEANDPKLLRAQIADLKERLAAKTLPDAERRAFEEGVQAGRRDLRADVATSLRAAHNALNLKISGALTQFGGDLDSVTALIEANKERPSPVTAADKDALVRVFGETAVRKALSAPRLLSADVEAASIKAAKAMVVPYAERLAAAAPEGAAPVTKPERRVLDALAYWAALGIAEPTREMIGAASGYSPGSGNFGNLLGSLMRKDMIAYPRPGAASLTELGATQASLPRSLDPPLQRVKSILSDPQARVLQAVANRGSTTREEIAAATGYSAGSGNFGNLLGALRTLTMIDYPGPGRVAIAGWLR